MPTITLPPSPTLFGLRTSTEQSNLFGIQGAPNSGKTTAALSFPSPIFLDFDKKLPPGVTSVPFWDPKFVDSMNCPRRHPSLPNRRDALEKWLTQEGPKIPQGSTLVLDSWTRLQDSFDQSAFRAPSEYFSKANEVDGFKIYKHKNDWSTLIIALLQGLSCDVVITFHEVIDRDDDGLPNGKTKPLMTGQFADKLAGYCSTFVRQLVEVDKTTSIKRWLWQVGSDNKFNAIVSPRYSIPPTCQKLDITGRNAYETLNKYLVTA